MKKAIAAVLLYFCLAMLHGCAHNPAESTAPPETTVPVRTTAPTETTLPEPTEYHFPEDAEVMLSVGFNVRDMQINKFIKDATGLNVYGYQRKEGGIMGGPPPAYSLVLTTVEIANAHGQYGPFVNLMAYQEAMPNFFSLFYSEENAAYREMYMLDEDELYIAPVFTSESTEHCAWIYREDIFRELNLEVPTDWDSFYAVLKALKAAYPESTPFTMRGFLRSMPGLVEFAQQFGVDYCEDGFAADQNGTFYDATVTEEMREMLKKLRLLIEEGLMAKPNSKEEESWFQALTEGTSFITHDRASQLQILEAAGQESNAAFSLSWFNNIPLADSDLPYATRMKPLSGKGWIINPEVCPDIELAVHFLDWLYSEEGILTTCWGQAGVSYGMDESGKKYYLDDFIADTENKQLLASPNLFGVMDFDAVLADYTPKNREMILDTAATAKAGGFYPAPKLNHTGEEKEIVDLYLQGYLDTRHEWLQNFLLGRPDINNDADWQRMQAALEAQNASSLLKAYNATYRKSKQGG